MSDKLPISLVVITLNEERKLEGCLRAAACCSELLVIDSGSTDRTLEIARECGARVIHRDWTGYGDQKNFGSQQAANDWVLCIDADEQISPELRASLFQMFRSDPPFDALELNRRNFYAGKAILHSGWYPQWKLFLYRKQQVRWDSAEPHPLPVLAGKRKGRVRGDLYHYTYTDIPEHIRKTLNFAVRSAEAMQRRGRRASFSDLLFRPLWAFFRPYIIQRGILDGFYGLVIAVIAGWYTFMKYALLRERNRASRAVSLKPHIPVEHR